jgi:hypothetical protein
MSKKKITVITFNASNGLIHQRLHLPFRHLRDVFDFHFVDLVDARHEHFFYTDCVVFCHAHGMDFLNIALKCRHHYAVPLVVDLDDLLMDLPLDHPEKAQLPARGLVDMLQLATEVVYSTEFLKTKLRHLNKNVTVIENTLPQHIFENYTQPARPYKTSFTVGWTGGNSHGADQLFTFYNGLREFLIKHADARAHFHGLCPSMLHKDLGAQVYFDPQMVDFLDYHATCETYPFDVCLVGLIDHQFNHAKSDLRLIDMAPHDIPIIASPRSDFIRHKDKNICLYAEDNDPNYMSWLEALEYAKANPDEMKAMAARAKEYVLSERLSNTAAKQWFEVLTRVTSRPNQYQQMGRELAGPLLQLQQLD